jgi:ABC-type bacteriocin/lantibiotic exporter with double-glycine peptidase domain
MCSCAGNISRYRPEPLNGLPLRHTLDDVPFFPQADYQCGPAALAMTLAWSGLAVTPETLTASVYTPAIKGSIQPAMIGAARRFGRIAYIISAPEELIAEIAAGRPVIVLQNLGLSWYPVWHYAVAIGYDSKAGYMLLHSGKIPRKRMPLKLFNRTWARSDYWGMMTIPPNMIPATATEADFVESVFGLEQAGRRQAALEG